LERYTDSFINILTTKNLSQPWFSKTFMTFIAAWATSGIIAASGLNICLKYCVIFIVSILFRNMAASRILQACGCMPRVEGPHYLNCIKTSVSVTDTNQLTLCRELCDYWMWDSGRIIDEKAEALHLNLTVLILISEV